jgi:adenylyl- and sulfurtransferase ThiI
VPKPNVRFATCSSL